MTDKLLLAEARALILQLFARGDYRSGGTTEKQVNYLIDRITKALY